jgi:plastocyanin
LHENQESIYANGNDVTAFALFFKRSRTSSLTILLVVSLSSLAIFPSSNMTYAEDVIFIVPGAGDPSLELDFDPQLQVIGRGQEIVFVNADFVEHNLVVKTADDEQVFNTGVLKNNQFVSHTFSDLGEYSLQCTLFPHMKGEIKVTDDIITLTKTIDEQNLEVQLTRSPAYPGVGEDVFFKVIFIDKNTGRNHSHIDYSLSFDDSQDTYVDGMGGHTVDGAEYGSFTFDQEDKYTPKITVSGIDFVPIQPATVEFGTVVTPEFPSAIMAMMVAVVIGSTIALYRRKLR